MRTEVYKVFTLLDPSIVYLCLFWDQDTLNLLKYILCVIWQPSFKASCILLKDIKILAFEILSHYLVLKRIISC